MSRKKEPVANVQDTYHAGIYLEEGKQDPLISSKIFGSSFIIASDTNRADNPSSLDPGVRTGRLVPNSYRYHDYFWYTDLIEAAQNTIQEI